jgi:hypothetical protein
LFFSGESEEISFVPPRNNQAVSVTQRESVWKRSRAMVACADRACGMTAGVKAVT